jgi:acetylglutamate kinase
MINLEDEAEVTEAVAEATEAEALAVVEEVTQISNHKEATKTSSSINNNNNYKQVAPSYCHQDHQLLW